MGSGRHSSPQIIDYVKTGLQDISLEGHGMEALEGPGSDEELPERRPFEKDPNEVLEWVINTEPSSMKEFDQDPNMSNIAPGGVESHLPEYEKFIQESIAYKDWLLSNIRQIGRLESGNPDLMIGIGVKVRSQLGAFNSLRKMSHRRQQSLIKMTFNLDWDPARFIHDQDSHDQRLASPQNDLENVVCLTGSWNNAQPATVVEYMGQTWPGTGQYIITLLQELIRLPKGQECSYQLPEHGSSRPNIHGLKNAQLTADTDNLDKLAFSLQNPGQESTNNASDIPCDSANPPIHDKPEDSRPTGTKAILRPLGSLTTKGNHAVASSGNIFESGDGRARFLALCVNTGAIYKTLAEIETSNVKSDAVAFN
ncbi:hypothetical protein PENANT_c072G04273 [Penicillium antarcticum]|uniref:Uncharacterized protein n=1 Tax=Penicillium antarcticum TaxID=416450 RepID=A0A1V6PQU5_9EURO|nr:hypothetical protein PENANT_c072G04273 [Penicillium antarcticum]